MSIRPQEEAVIIAARHMSWTAASVPFAVLCRAARAAAANSSVPPVPLTQSDRPLLHRSGRPQAKRLQARRFLVRCCDRCSAATPTELMAAPANVTLALRTALSDGCRADAYVDAHCHLEMILQCVRQHDLVPSLSLRWRDLSRKDRCLWQTLGWTRRQWEPMGSDPNDGETPYNDPTRNRTWFRRWSDLTPAECAAATALGWNANRWRTWDWVLPKGKDWEELPDDMRGHLEVLGETPDTWAEVFGYQPGRKGAGIDSDWRTWCQLTLKEQEAAAALGFSGPAWDMDELSDVHAYVRNFCGPGFEGCVAQGCDGDSIDDTQLLALAHPKIFASFGCHPKNAWLYEDDNMEERILEAFEACGDKAVAWGEFGLDYSNDNWGDLPDYQQEQQDIFVRQLKLALDRKLPLVLHIRAAMDDAVRLLRQWVPRDWKAHVHGCHCPPLVELLLEDFPNFHFGLTGTVTMGGEGFEMCQLVPLERMMLETDGPYLPPRGTHFNHVGQIPYVARRIAELKGCDPKLVLSKARANTRYIYGI